MWATRPIDPTGRESVLETGAIDKSFILETVPVIIEYACTVEVAWALAAETANLAARIWTWNWNKEYEPVPTPPLPLSVLCGWKEFGGGGGKGEGGGSE